MGRLEIDDFPLSNPRLEAAYTEFPHPAGMAVKQGLRKSYRRAREIEAHGLFRKPPLAGRKFCYTCSSTEEADLGSVNAVRRTVDEMAPDWVEVVKDAARVFNTPDLIKGWLDDEWGIPLQAVIAIMMNLDARGELPADAHSDPS